MTKMKASWLQFHSLIVGKPQTPGKEKIYESDWDAGVSKVTSDPLQQTLYLGF